MSAVAVSRFDAMRAKCESKPHGSRLRYIGGCRCVPCRAANSRYESERLRLRAAGDWNGIVSADRAREHMLLLSRSGSGRRAIRAATGISETVLMKIRTGKRAKIRARTERQILAVDESVRANKSLVLAAWQMLDELIAGGYTKYQLAAWLGSKAKVPALQLKRGGLITALSESKVERLYKRIMDGRVRR